MMEELPNGWVDCEIGDIAKVVGGGTPNASNEDNFSTESGIPWLTPADLSDYKGIYISRGKRFLTKRGYAESSAKLMPKGTVLFSSRAPIGYVAIAANEISTNQGFKSLLCAPGIKSEYLYFWMKYAKPMADELAQGTTFAEISGSNTARIPFRMPPTTEQKRIAILLEELICKVVNCQQRLATIPRTLKRFRQSVLAAACSGRLTADWRLNRRNCPWADVILTDVIREKPKNGYSVKPVRHKTQHRVLTLTATTSGKFDGKYFKYFNEAIPKESPLWLQPDDILIQRGNTIEYVGVPAIYSGCAGEFIYPDLMIRIRANSRVKTKFLYYALSWEKTRSYLRERAIGTAGNMPKINQETLVATPIRLPCIDEQDEIIRQVDNLLALADKIEVRYKVAQRQVDRLSQSILAKAFRGELVPTEVELAKREGRPYESAEQLLQCIQSSRNAAPPSVAKKRGKRSTHR